MKYKAPKGTVDILPNQVSRWQSLENIFADLCRRFSFQEIRVPTFEQTELFARGVGDGTDVVQKEMYTFLDKGNRSISLRPEITAGVVRAFIENGMSSLPYPLKLYYNMTCFRYEKMQKGRLREFHQFGCELFGAAGALAEVEIISLVHQFFLELGLKNISLEINTLGCSACRTKYLASLKAYMQEQEKDLCPTCQGRLERNVLRILDCKEEACQSIIKAAPSLKGNLCLACQEGFSQVQSHLDDLNIKYKVNYRMVRGLDYYTGLVFEFVSQNIGSQGTICGGGRYDRLVQDLGGDDVPAVGFGLGVERLLLELEAQGQEVKDKARPDLVIVSFPSTQDKAVTLVSELRRAGLVAETDMLGRSIKAQLKHANRLKSKFALVLGETELDTGMLPVRNLKSGQEDVIGLAHLSEYIREKRKKK